MNPNDVALCRKALATLTSVEHSRKNYLFLSPVSLDVVPGYLTIVPRPMDLGTVGKQLEAGEYSTTEAFWEDVKLTFHNAMKYHSTQPTSWICKVAEQMMKLCIKERSKMERKASGTSTATATSSSTGLKLKLSTKSSKKEPSHPVGDATTTDPMVPSPKPKISLKIKMPSGTDTPTATAIATAVAAAPSKPKLKLTLSLGKKPANAIHITSTTPIPNSTSPTAPNISLIKTPKANHTKNTTTSIGSTTTPRSITPKSATSKEKKSSAKIRLSAPSRGKELPKGVGEVVVATISSTPTAVAVASTSAITAPKSTAIKSNTTKSGEKKVGKPKKILPIHKVIMKPTTTLPAPKLILKTKPASVTATNNIMTEKRKAQCLKVIAGLKRRKSKDIIWFLQPVSDKGIVDDYRAKIKNAMDLGTMTLKLEKNEYRDLNEFVLDLRRVFGNCLRYNTSIKDSFRPLGMDMLMTAEQLMAHFIGEAEPTYLPLLYCWRLCVGILDALLNVTNPVDGHQTAHYFLHPVSFFFGGVFPSDYLDKITKPMDFGTVTSNLLEGTYQTVREFSNDCRLVVENCMTYYSDKVDGKVFTDQAGRLHALINQQLVALERYDVSEKAKEARAQATSWSNVRLEKPPPDVLLGMLVELRTMQYVDRLTKLSEPAMRPFEKTVDLSEYRDYLQFVRTPMCLEQVERKVKMGQYDTPEDFEYDVHLIFKNCEAYNAPKKSEHMVALGKYATKIFRKLFIQRMKAYENPELAVDKKRSSTSPASEQPMKKVKVESGSTQGAPRILIASASIASTPVATVVVNAPPRAKSVSLKPPSGVSGKVKSNSVVLSNVKPNQPVPLHVAIAQVKERFPLRRPYKLLQDWEGSCAKFFKELMRHPWISAARPKFIFHVPVPVLFPELRDAYVNKVKRPMDLTTAEAKLLQGGLYSSPQDFVDDVALVFANAIAFNKAGRDEGDPLSIAYYDASIHLLRYTRWLSLEWLDSYLIEDPHMDPLGENNMPPSSWKLSKANHQKGQEEMQRIVLQEHIEKSFEGDRYTWMETECEKLLKSLRHQSDLRYMTFFLQPAFPPDYTAYISKPIAWENCYKALQKRQYERMGDIVEDLRLIFVNALKYNSRHQGLDTVSGKAYDAAVYMSAKLEAAIDKMMVTVADRLERERIDSSISERELEAQERAEDERIRAAIKDGTMSADQSGVVPGQPNKIETVETTTRVFNRRLVRKEIDFDVAFVDEDDGNHEQSHVEMMRQQKATFERQRQQHTSLGALALTTGGVVYARMAQCDQANRWVKRMVQLMTTKVEPPKVDIHKDVKEHEEYRFGSSVLAELENANRQQISIKPIQATKKRKRNIASVFNFE